MTGDWWGANILAIECTPKGTTLPKIFDSCRYYSFGLRKWTTSKKHDVIPDLAKLRQPVSRFHRGFTGYVRYVRARLEKISCSANTTKQTHNIQARGFDLSTFRIGAYFAARAGDDSWSSIRKRNTLPRESRSNREVYACRFEVLNWIALLLLLCETDTFTLEIQSSRSSARALQNWDHTVVVSLTKLLFTTVTESV